MANFFILAFILYRFLFKPLQNTLKTREEKTTQMMDAAESARQDAEAERLEYEEKTDNIDAEMAARKNEARILIEQSRQQMLIEVQSEIDRLKHQTKEVLAKLRADALHQHRNEIGTQAAKFAEGLLSDLMNPQLQDVYQNAFIEQIRQSDLSEHVSAADQGETEFIDVILPLPPSPAFTEKFSQLLAQKLNQEIKLNVEVDSKLLAGGILRFEDILIDGSLTGQIKQFQKQYQQMD